MNESPDRQLDIPFCGNPTNDGYNQWREQRRLAMDKLAKQIGLPLNHRVEVWLKGGIRLRGMLKPREELLFVPETRDARMEFVVDNVPFTAAEIESCVRTD